MRIVTKLVLPSILLLILTLGAAVYLFLEMRETEQLLEANAVKIRDINSFSRGFNELTDRIARNLLLYRIDRDPSRIDSMAQAQAQIETLLDRFQRMSVSPRALNLADAYAVGRREEAKLRTELLTAVNGNDQNRIQSALNRWLIHAKRNGALLDDLLTALTNEVERTTEEISKDWTGNQRLTGAFLTLILALVGASSFYYVRVVSRPIQRLAGIAGEISRGNIGAQIAGFDSYDEIGRLAYAFKDMTQNLIEANAGLERKVAERTAELAVLAGIVESSNDAIIGENPDGTITSWNKAAEKIYGYSRKEALGKSISMLLPPEQAEKSLEIFKRVASGESVQHYESVRLRKDGSKVDVSLTLSPICDAANRIVGVSAIARDVTERKRAQEQLHLQLQRISALREINLAITSTLDQQTVLKVLMEEISVFLPHAAVLLWLSNPETAELERAACWNLDETDWKSRRLSSVPKLVKTALQNKKPVFTLNVQTDPRTLDANFYKRNGLISYLGVPLRVRDEALGVLVFLTREEHEYDKEEIEFLSQLANQAAIAIHNSQLHQKTQKQALSLEEASKLQADFTAMMAHDLRSPLSNMTGIAEMMENGLFGPLNEGQKDWLRRMRNNATGLIRLISDFLDLSKLEAGNIELSRTPTDIQDLIRNVVEEHQPLAKSKRIDLSYRADSSLPAVFIDGRRLDQVLNNLLSNALKFTSNGGSIQIRIRPQNGTGVMVQVQDSGVGIPQNEIGKLFQKYRQTSSSTAAAQKGTGLGLVICKMIVEAHGGRIWAESEAGNGTTFTFTLPFHQPAQPTDNRNSLPANNL